MIDQFFCQPIEAGSPSDLPTNSATAHIVYEEGAETLNNTTRAKWAAEGVREYAQRVGLFTGDPCDTAIRDLLSDLMHLVDGLRQTESLEEPYTTFDRMLESARNRYEEEIAGEF